MIENIFFHPLAWDNDMYIVYIAWGLIIAATLWLVRFAYKSLRKTKMKYQNVECYLCRDIFMLLTGFEYLTAYTVLLSFYLGWWAYEVKPSTGDWTNWQTYMVVLPQLACILTVVIIFVIRYTKFRKPYIK